MATKRKIEVFGAGCPLCEEAADLVRRLACPSCEVVLLDMNDIDVARRARDLGVRRVPAIAIDGKLAACCASGPIDEVVLRAAGLGQP